MASAMFRARIARSHAPRGFRISSAAELFTFLISFQQRFAAPDRRIDPTINRGPALYATQQAEVVAEPFKMRCIGEIAWLHRERPAIRMLFGPTGFSDPQILHRATETQSIRSRRAPRIGAAVAFYFN